MSAFKSLATRLREGHVKDRRYKLRNYPRCFTGRRALQLTRVHMPKAHAVALLRRFVEWYMCEVWPLRVLVGVILDISTFLVCLLNSDWIINVVDNSVRFSASRSALYSFVCGYMYLCFSSVDMKRVCVCVLCACGMVCVMVGVGWCV